MAVYMSAKDRAALIVDDVCTMCDAGEWPKDAESCPVCDAEIPDEPEDAKKPATPIKE